MLTGSKITEIELGDHLCMIYYDEEDKLYTEILFIVDGLKNDELVVLLNEDEEELTSILSQLVDVRRFLEKEQLIFLSKDESYLRDGFFDADRMLKDIAELDEKALVDGYRGLRLVGDASSLNYLKAERFLEFEAKLNRLLPLTRSIVLCFFHEKTNPDFLLKVLQVHPKLITGKEVKENPNYVPPDEFLKKLKGIKKKDKGLQRLISKKLEREFGEMEEKFRLLFESSFEAIIILKGDRIVSCNPKAMEILGIRNFRQLLGRKIYEIFGNESELKSRIEAAKTEPQFFEISLNKKGKRVELEASLTKVSDKLMMVARDVTERREMERKLKESEHRFRMLVESSIDAIITINSRAEILTWNKGAEKIYGYKAEEVIGKPLTILMPERSRERFRRGFSLFESAFKPGFEFDYPLGRVMEVICLRKNGEEFPAELSYHAWKSDDKIFFTSIVRDVSERKKLEEMLRQSEEKYRKLWENAGDILFIMDLEGNFIEANRAARELFGYTKEEVTKLNVKDVVAEDFLPGVYKEIGNFTSGKSSKISKLELLCFTKNGKEVWLESRAKPVIENGKILAIQGIARDITERKKLEESLKENEELFRTLAEKSLVGVYLIQDGVFKYVNPKLAELWGYSVEELVGKNPLEFIHPDDRELVRRNLEKRIKGEIDSIKYRLRVVRKDKEVRYNDVYGSRIFYKGKPAVIGTLLDVTERIRLENERLKAFRQIEKNIENYAILVDHIRNPLAAILGLAEMEIKDDKLRKKFENLVYRIEEVVEKLDNGWLESEKIRKFLQGEFKL